MEDKAIGKPDMQRLFASLWNKQIFYTPFGKKVKIETFTINDEYVISTVSYPEGKKRTTDIIELANSEWASFYNQYNPLKEPEKVKKDKPVEMPETETLKPEVSIQDVTQESNIQSLRQRLFAAIDNLNEGKINADQAKSLASLAQTIINSAKIELEYKRGLNKDKSIKMLE